MQFTVGGDAKHKDKTEQSEAVNMNRWMALAKLVTPFVSLTEWSTSLS